MSWLTLTIVSPPTHRPRWTKFPTVLETTSQPAQLLKGLLARHDNRWLARFPVAPSHCLSRHSENAQLLLYSLDEDRPKRSSSEPFVIRKSRWLCFSLPAMVGGFPSSVFYLQPMWLDVGSGSQPFVVQLFSMHGFPDEIWFQIINYCIY